MSSLLKFHLFVACIIFATLNLKGQGCSDAGFCTINDLKPQLSDSISVFNQLKLGVSNGAGDHSISIIAPYIEYNRQLSKKTGINVKLTALSQRGNGISAYGLSDLFIVSNYKFSEIIKATAGLKIPLADGNKKKDGLPLPMDYQSSLGTIDVIAGVRAKFKNFELVAAIQQPVTQNKNEFIAEIFSEESILSNFQSTNNYERNGDILLRASYTFKINNEFKISPGLLPIYHLSNDKFTNLNNEVTEIKGSQGLTLNAILYFDYSINQTNSLQLSFGTPLISRDTRPDGLTRSYVVNLEYGLRF